MNNKFRAGVRVRSLSTGRIGTVMSIMARYSNDKVAMVSVHFDNSPFLGNPINVSGLQIIDQPKETAFGNIVDSLRQFNMGRQIEFVTQKMRDSMSDEQFASEFKTVRINAGRCTGKTTYIAERADSCDLIVVGNFQMRDYLNVMLSEFGSVCDVVVVRPHEPLESQYIRGADIPKVVYRDVYVDEAECTNMDFVYHWFKANNQYILFG